ncbi:uncharacterized protein LOC117181827 isoform X2 [Belonocnema kinseyi]|uniref:uncharacterized protein LOC117181827 isoform X2 n=1 Tax=Belonocnema kinseyi TaxID=2817044 RepID=UPI00143DE6D5|nr:uncharacterized protein LOC117181827 isoform X2 [Belonocnema kinseyi]
MKTGKMEESEDADLNLETFHKQPGAVPSIFNASKNFSENVSKEKVAMKPNEKFLEMYEAIFFKEKELVIPEELKTIVDIAGMEKVLGFVAKIAPCEKPDRTQRAKECVGYFLPKKQNDSDPLKNRCFACRKLLKKSRPKLRISRWRDNSILGAKCNNLQRKYHSLQRKVKTCLLEIGELKKDAAKNKTKVLEAPKPKVLTSQGEGETIFLRDLNSNTANEKDVNETRAVISDPLEIDPFSSFYEDSLWSLADSDENKPVSKKARNPEKEKYDWKKHKEACNKGQAYLNKKGILVRARKMGAGCDETCRFRCQERISLENRQKVFDYYWKLGSHPLQWNFLLKVVGSTEPKSQKTNSTSKKKWTRNYSLPAENKRIKVCKTMFLKTLDISDSIVETALTKVRQNDALIDRRGKNSKTNHKKLDAMNESVRDHLNILPISEYKFLYDGCKKQTSVKKVNIRHMYKVYKDWMERERKGEPIAGEKRYRYNFKLGFKLKFKQENIEID